jgi:hypothetical protein
MKLRGLQIRGLDVVGEQRLDLDAGFTVVETHSLDRARVLASLLSALLCPERDLPRLGFWTVAPRARAALALALAQGTYVLVARSAERRLSLARHDAARGGYQEVSSDPLEIAALLREAGVPQARELLLHTWGVQRAARSERDEADDDTLRTDRLETRVRLEAELSDLRAVAARRVELARRADRLHRARERLTACASALEAARGELQERSALAPLLEGIDERIARFERAQQGRERDHQAIERLRRDLLEQRSQLRASRLRRRIPGLLGALLALSGGGAALLLGQPLALGLCALGLGLAGWVEVGAWLTRRELGRVEGTLSGLRLRERSAEGRFEAETAELRDLMGALDLPGLDELRAAVEAQRELAKRLPALEDDLARARADFPDTAAVELEALEGELREPDPTARCAALESELAGLAPAPAPGELETSPAADPDPDELVAAAGRSLGIPDEEVRTRLLASLPPYLRALSGGRYTRARHGLVEGWVLRQPEGQSALHSELEPAPRRRVLLAFQLALLESIGAHRRVPLIVGPDHFALEPAETRTVARALRRLASLIQVIRIGPPDPDFAEQAERVIRLE